MGVHRPDPYRFSPVREADLALLRRWLQAPAVARWWGDPDEEAQLLREGLADPTLAMWIVEHHGRPFAYAQDYDLHRGWPDHPWPDLPAATRGIDQFIGEGDMLGRGHGSAFIRALATRLHGAGTACLVTDPHPDNVRARRAYASAGFVGDEVHQTSSGPIVLMTRNMHTAPLGERPADHRRGPSVDGP